MCAMPPSANDPTTNDPAHPAAGEGTAPQAAPAAPRARSVIELVWGAVATAMAVVYTAIFAPLAALAGILGYPHLATPVTRMWARLILGTCGVRVEIDGLKISPVCKPTSSSPIIRASSTSL